MDEIKALFAVLNEAKWVVSTFDATKDGFDDMEKKSIMSGAIKRLHEKIKEMENGRTTQRKV